jgi:hypothetical protein
MIRFAPLYLFFSSLAVCHAVLLSSLPSLPLWSAEQITIKSQGKAYTINVGDVETFLQTGEGEMPLPEFIKQNPLMRFILLQLLRQEFSLAGMAATNPLIEGIASELLLSQIAQIVRPAGSADGRTALRTALNASFQDGKFSPLRFVKNFPDQEIIIDGDRLADLQKLFADKSPATAK